MKKDIKRIRKIARANGKRLEKSKVLGSVADFKGR